MMGGATYLEAEIWEQHLSKSVSGKIKNIYSKDDFILVLYKLSQHHNPVGRDQIMLKSEANRKVVDLDREKRLAVSDAHDFSL